MNQLKVFIENKKMTTIKLLENKSGKIFRGGKRQINESNINSQYLELLNEIDNQIIKLKSEKETGIKILKSIRKKITTLFNDFSKLYTLQQKKSKKSENKYGFQKQVQISVELSKFTGWSIDKLKSRAEVTKFICEYIKNNNLQKPQDKRYIYLDEKLKKLFNYTLDTPIRYCDIQTFLSTQNHFPKNN
jgi:chromatin remodeling complex protein RSC6